MSVPTLYYFDGRGLGETPRLILNYFGQEFKDVRIQESTVPADLKAKTPYGQLPWYVEDDQFSVAQSVAINHYLSLKYKLQGNSIRDQAIVLELVHAANELLTGYWSQDTDTKKEKYQKVTVPTILKRFNHVLTNNKQSSNHFVGDALTLADFSIFNVIDYLVWNTQNTHFTDLPALLQFHKEFQTNTNISNYIKKRVDTDF
ncbi:hypothetical protein PPL_10987 [Heterostelium album PN500]|uniref:Glutathione S-transferase n=1 Tax=Heterostelium pallidum (strain ATCC 26659 / Pp 5 / PN500) TaxID=670386 RepID=D3BSL8_HETP5|nr:hypothetical protein PPL_10987 [Heterostelium album PN500]EFA75483.1 hypothetical protein PPL_10987 [Heterostelium album PN500]|eukprot:XP_020427617.1 hypothetical protein PPL_10987 [Heterostelium album PN500]